MICRGNPMWVPLPTEGNHAGLPLRVSPTQKIIQLKNHITMKNLAFFLITFSLCTTSLSAQNEKFQIPTL